MAFKNQKELERFLMKKCRLAMIKASNEIYAIIKEVLYNYYMDYKPDEEYGYDRTLQLLQSLVVPRIVSDGKGYKAEVYFNLDYLYKTGANPSGEQVMEAANAGMHGASGLLMVPGKTGANIWPETELIMDAVAIDTLRDALIAHGVPIK